MARAYGVAQPALWVASWGSSLTGPPQQGGKAMKSLTLWSCLVCLLSVSASFAGGPWYVGPGGLDANDCLSPATPCGSISAAIGKYASGDTIRVAVGTYTGTGDEVVRLDRSLTPSGGWNGAFTAQSGTSEIDGETQRRGVTVGDGVTTTMERFVIRRGDAFAGSGGAVLNGANSTLTLDGCTLSDNEAPLGGGGALNPVGSTLLLNDCTISGNRGGNGGGGEHGRAVPSRREQGRVTPPGDAPSAKPGCLRDVLCVAGWLVQ